MTRIAEMEGMAVRTEAGERMGHVWEIRSPGHAKREPRRAQRPIECLLCGRLGLLERLGWREPLAHAVPWTAVVAREGRTLVVRGRRDDYERVRSGGH